MKLESIYELWDVDSKIDDNDLGGESTKIPSLHNKYYRIYVEERLKLRKLEAEMKMLKLEKYEFYTQGPTKDQAEKGWHLPPAGRILKAEVNNYMEADRDLINLSLKIGVQQEKTEFLESIIKSFNSRGFNIKAAIEWRKFQMGM